MARRGIYAVVTPGGWTIKLVKRGIYAVVTPDGEWTIKFAKQSAHLIILYPANPGTDDTFPPYVDRKHFPDPIVGRVVWVWQSSA